MLLNSKQSQLLEKHIKRSFIFSSIKAWKLSIWLQTNSFIRDIRRIQIFKESGFQLSLSIFEIKIKSILSNFLHHCLQNWNKGMQQILTKRKEQIWKSDISVFITFLCIYTFSIYFLIKWPQNKQVCCQQMRHTCFIKS